MTLTLDLEGQCHIWFPMLILLVYMEKSTAYDLLFARYHDLSAFAFATLTLDLEGNCHILFNMID